MRFKIYITFFIITLISYEVISQETEELFPSIKVGFGKAGNDIQPNGYDLQFAVQIHQKAHTISFIADRGKYSTHIPYQSDREVLYRSYNYGATYGLSYNKKFFWAEFGAGIGVIGTQSQRRIDCTKIQGTLNGKPCFENVDYYKVNVPAFICVSLKGKYFGLYFQTKYDFSFPRIDYRHTIGLRFDIRTD